MANYPNINEEKQKDIEAAVDLAVDRFYNLESLWTHVAKVCNVSRTTARKFGLEAAKKFQASRKIELVEIGNFSKKVEDLGFEPETSSDYEIPNKTEPRDKKKEALSLMPEMPQMTDKQQRWLILPDIHVPFHNEKAIQNVLEYASEIHWDGVIQLGDFMDWDFISRWTKENQRKIEGKRFMAEYDAANPVLDQIVSAARNKNPNAKITIIEGNHDWRIENVVDKTPSLEGLVEMEKNLRLGERNITYWRYWTHRKPYIIGKAWFIHGEYIGANHAKKTADSFHRNVFYGHTHDRMSHTKTTVASDSVMCESLGTLSLLELEYMGSKPSNWSQNFAEFFFNPDGTFNHYVTNIIDNSFTAINGKVYGAWSKGKHKKMTDIR